MSYPKLAPLARITPCRLISWIGRDGTFFTGASSPHCHLIFCFGWQGLFRYLDFKRIAISWNDDLKNLRASSRRWGWQTERGWVRTL